MQGAARQFKAFEKWTDEYLVAQHGDIKLSLEPKKEHRKMQKSLVSLKEYISFYETRNVYSVTAVYPELRWDTYFTHEAVSHESVCP